MILHKTVPQNLLKHVCCEIWLSMGHFSICIVVMVYLTPSRKWSLLYFSKLKAKIIYFPWIRERSQRQSCKINKNTICYSPLPTAKADTSVGLQPSRFSGALGPEGRWAQGAPENKTFKFKTKQTVAANLQKTSREKHKETRLWYEKPVMLGWCGTGDRD